MIDYKTSNNNGFRCIFIVNGSFSNLTWGVPLNSKNSQTLTDELANILTSSKRSPLKIKSDRGKEFHNSFFFQKFFEVKKLHHYSRFTDKGPSIAERVVRTIRCSLNETCNSSRKC